MASPDSPLDRLQATFDFGGLAVQQWVYEHLPFEAQILDVGAGWGKYRNLLPDYENIDACEIWKPYVVQERLWERYRTVYECGVYEMRGYLPDYDAVIFGDVLEHLGIDHAQLVLSRCRCALVVVPYEFEQDEENGNPYEAHIQDDLTMEIMTTRYPELHCWAHEEKPGPMQVPVPFKGFYVKDVDES